MIGLIRFLGGYDLSGRTQALTAHVLLALALFFVAPVVKPSLWILEEWGGLHIHMWIWGALFAITSLAILASRSCRAAHQMMMLAAVLLGTVSVAAYLSLGWNAGSIATGILALHTIGNAAEMLRRGRA